MIADRSGEHALVEVPFGEEADLRAKTDDVPDPIVACAPVPTCCAGLAEPLGLTCDESTLGDVTSSVSCLATLKGLRTLAKNRGFEEDTVPTECGEL